MTIGSLAALIAGAVAAWSLAARVLFRRNGGVRYVTDLTNLRPRHEAVPATLAVVCVPLSPEEPVADPAQIPSGRKVEIAGLGGRLGKKRLPVSTATVVGGCIRGVAAADIHSLEGRA